MADLQVAPSSLSGNVFIPPSKSHTLRAILFAALSQGDSKIEQFLPSPDTYSMIEAVRNLGAQVKVEPNVLHIRGFAGKPQPAADVIQCGNSGQVLRFIGALAGLIPHYTILTGDASIRHQRPIQPLIEALNQLGAFGASSRGDGYAPLLVKGPFTQGFATLEGRDSQPVSGLLIAAAFAPHPIELHVTHPGEKPWIDLTLHWLKKLGIPYSAQGYTQYRLFGKGQITGFTYRVPGDLSTAAFPIVAALLTQSELTLHNVDLEDVQGDKAVIPLLQQMGAKIAIDQKKRTLSVKKGGRLKGMRIDINNFIDALPILAVVGCFAEGRTEIVNGAMARNKESDRISAMACELRKMGAQIEEQADGLVISSSPLHGATLHTYHDHRIALSLSVAALAAKGSSLIQGIECADKTYPSFVSDFQSLGAKLSLSGS